jgi:hypothetical protein
MRRLRGREGRREQPGAAAGAAGPAREADRMGALLLAAVGHDLRSPLAAARAAAGCLRSRDLQLSAADQDELLATAEEPLELLSRLAASLLDMTRLQAGARSVFPRPADLEEIIGCALAGLGAQARAVRVDLPPGLPEVMADPPVLERVIANVTANALRCSPHGSPPLESGSAAAPDRASSMTTSPRSAATTTRRSPAWSRDTPASPSSSQRLGCPVGPGTPAAVPGGGRLLVRGPQLAGVNPQHHTGRRGAADICGDQCPSQSHVTACERT